MAAATALTQEKIWTDKSMYDKAECRYFERLAKVASNYIGKYDSFVSKSSICTDQPGIVIPSSYLTSSSKKLKEKKNKSDKKNKYVIQLKDENLIKGCQILSQGNEESSDVTGPVVGSLANEVAKARQHIKKGLQCVNDITDTSSKSSIDVPSRFEKLEKENQDLRSLVKQLNDKLSDLSITVGDLKQEVHSRHVTPTVATCPAKVVNENAKPASKNDNNDNDDDDFDLFGSDSESEDEEAATVRRERLSAYAAKKSKKPALIAKSSIVLEVKPWDDETDMEIMEAEVRKITMDGLLWGAAKLVPLAYGIMKLQISCVIEDDKVSVDELTEKIESIEDLVQSVDIAAFNKI